MIRKILNIKTPSEASTLWEEWRRVYMNAKKISNDENRRQREICDFANNTCQNCKSTKVVDRFVGYKTIGFGGYDQLQKCRHCSDCGMDWNIMEPDNSYPWDITSEWYRELATLIENNKHTKEDIFFLCPHFNNIHAETFKMIYDDFSYMYDKPKKIKLKKLRTIYKSIFDKDE